MNNSDFILDLVNNSEFRPELVVCSSPLVLRPKLRRTPGSPPPRSPSRWYKLFKIFAQNLLRLICLMPFILVCKSIYCCLHNDIWTFTYFFQQFISHIPIIGSSLLSLLNDQGYFLSIDSIKNNQFIGNLIFSGWLGSSMGKALLDIFLFGDKLPMGPVPLGNFSDKPLKIPQSGINKLSSSFLMQADNTGEAGKKISSEVTGAASPPSPPSGGLSGRHLSFEALDKLLADRNKLISDAKKFLQEKGNSAQPHTDPSTKLVDKATPPKPIQAAPEGKPSSMVTSGSSPTDNKNILDVLKYLGDIRLKHNEAVRYLIKGHTSILGLEFMRKEIKPLVDELDISWEEFLTDMNKIRPYHPNEGKQLHDLANRTFKLHGKINLKIEGKLFEEMENLNKQGRLPEGFLADYKKNIQKTWTKEREAFMAEQKKLKKEAVKIFEKK